MLFRVLSKSYGTEKETLGRHNGKLLNCANVIYELLNDKHPINKDMLNINTLVQ